MDVKVKEKRIGEAQEIMNWTILHLNGSIKCKVTDYKHENFRVQFFSKDGNLIMPSEIPDEWVEATDPKQNVVYDKLEFLVNNLEKM
jgi:hypothetical protein